MMRGSAKTLALVFVFAVGAAAAVGIYYYKRTPEGTPTAGPKGGKTPTPTPVDVKPAAQRNTFDRDGLIKAGAFLSVQFRDARDLSEKLAAFADKIQEEDALDSGEEMVEEMVGELSGIALEKIDRGRPLFLVLFPPAEEEPVSRYGWGRMPRKAVCLPIVDKETFLEDLSAEEMPGVKGYTSIEEFMYYDMEMALFTEGYAVLGADEETLEKAAGAVEEAARRKMKEDIRICFDAKAMAETWRPEVDQGIEELRSLMDEIMEELADEADPGELSPKVGQMFKGISNLLAGLWEESFEQIEGFEVKVTLEEQSARVGITLHAVPNSGLGRFLALFPGGPGGEEIGGLLAAIPAESQFFLAGNCEPSEMESLVKGLKRLTAGRDPEKPPAAWAAILDAYAALCPAQTGTFSSGIWFEEEKGRNRGVFVYGLKDPAAARRAVREFVEAINQNGLQPLSQFLSVESMEKIDVAVRYEEGARTGPGGVAVDVFTVELKGDEYFLDDLREVHEEGLASWLGKWPPTLRFAFTDKYMVMVAGPDGDEQMDAALRRIAAGRGGIGETAAVRMMKENTPEEAWLSGFVFPSEITRYFMVLDARYYGPDYLAGLKPVVRPGDRPAFFWMTSSGPSATLTYEITVEVARRCMQLSEGF